MAGYRDTFMGDVHTWEVDATEHFTVAYYYEKFEAATRRFLRQEGLDANPVRTRKAWTHYKAELRNRDIYRIETGLLAGGDEPIIGHRLFNADTGTLCTTMQQTLQGARLSGPEASWDGDERVERPVPGDEAGWMLSLMDMVRPEEADWAGELALPGYIHRFSTANSFVTAAFGMTPGYMAENRLGLSTFEFELKFHAPARPDDLLDMQSCIAHLGGSSLRICHRLRNADSGATLAELGQFAVQLDLDARRPSRIADELREKAQALL